LRAECMSDDVIRSFELDEDDDLLLDDLVTDELAEVAVALSQSTIETEGKA
jgi:hypothetical protein